MKKRTLGLLAVAPLVVSLLTGFATLSTGASPYELILTPGSEWIHAFSLLVKNPPQYAVWLEDEAGHYAGTLYVTEKIGRAGWLMNKGNPRIEALPVWTHRRHSANRSQGLLPTKENPVADSETGATPRAGHRIPVPAPFGSSPFWLYLEVNHSTDFNETWPKSARPGERGWSGGKEGSGQPSLVYRVRIDPRDQGPWTLELAGHGKADGSDGSLDSDLSGITTARSILKSPIMVRRVDGDQ